MSAKIIVSYDGTANEDDAVALGRRLRATPAPRSRSPTCATPRTRSATRRGSSPAACSCSATADAATHVVTDRSTPEGLAALAEREQADVIVFCSDSHTAKGHVSIGQLRAAAARRRPHGGRDRARRLRRDEPAGAAASWPSATATAARARPRQSLAGALGAEVVPVAGRGHRPARARLARRRARGPRLAERLGRTPRRDRDAARCSCCRAACACSSAACTRQHPPGRLAAQHAPAGGAPVAARARRARRARRRADAPKGPVHRRASARLRPPSTALPSHGGTVSWRSCQAP